MSDRQRRYKLRQRQGEAVYRVTANDRLLYALISAGRLTNSETLDRDRIEVELTIVVQEWAERWTANSG